MIFKLTGVVTISISTEVEAKTLEEAIEIAKDRDIEQSNYRDDEQIREVWVSDGYDGSATNIEEE